ncbi:hypothetical protein DICVIV_07517 [Dictyocaulus viviparus]|uniref:Uncharacterized protein n=1 Tax=Dictyocaulus viviparus TaxID=29172 RepID=A0A0D8XP77_DICVI|nr:hypothetical protein DICVIV_07517 [Dictyocaulus viviparus]
MRSGPFCDRATADIASEALMQHMAQDGFTDTLVSYLKFIFSMPERPDQPTMALQEILEVPFERVDTRVLMSVLRDTRVELTRALEKGRKLKLRYDELHGIISEAEDGIDVENMSR